MTKKFKLDVSKLEREDSKYQSKRNPKRKPWKLFYTILAILAITFLSAKFLKQSKIISQTNSEGSKRFNYFSKPSDWKTHFGLKSKDGVAQILKLPPVTKIPPSWENLRDKITLYRFKKGQEWINIIDPSLEGCGAAFGMQVGQEDAALGNYYDGLAHLLEHSVYLGQTKKEISLFTDDNAYTAFQSTGYKFGSDDRKFVNAFAVLLDDLYNFKAYPKIKDEVSAIQNE